MYSICMVLISGVWFNVQHIVTIGVCPGHYGKSGCSRIDLIDKTHKVADFTPAQVKDKLVQACPMITVSE